MGGSCQPNQKWSWGNRWHPCARPSRCPYACPASHCAVLGSDAKDDGGGEQQESAGSGKRERQQIQQLQQEIKKLKQNAGPSKGDNKGKGKGKGGGKAAKDKDRWTSSSGPMPAELMGMERSYKGKPICFSYNCASGCNNSVDSMGSCKKGKHLCARSGCGGNHSAAWEGCPKR